MKPGSSHGSSATRLHHVQGGSTCQQAREREGDGANGANASELRGGKSLLSPTRTSPSGKTLTTTSKSEVRSLCVSDICIRISPSERERERWERVEKPRSHFLVRPGRQSSSVPPRPMGGCESPPAIAGRCSPHPGRLAAFLPGAQLILLSPGTGYCLADCRTSALLQAARRSKMVL